MSRKPKLYVVQGANAALAPGGQEPPPPPGSPGLSCLIVISGEHLGRKYDVGDAALTIGRDAANDIHIEQESISQTHATVQRDERGVRLRDQGSTHGTYVNDEKVEEAYLADGDLIKVGRAIFKFLDGRDLQRAYNEEIHRLSTVDGLTEVFNKRYFVHTLEREVSRSRRLGQPLSMLMFDLDHLKRYNDEHTHRAGDDVLRQVALLARDRSRKVDVVARFGGEEFAVLLPGLGGDAATAYAEDLRREIADTPFTFEDHTLPMTVSVGVATMDERFEDARALLQHADTQMQAAKDRGRNCVVG